MLNFSKDFPPDKLLRNTALHSFKTILFQGGNQEHQASQKPVDLERSKKKGIGKKISS